MVKLGRFAVLSGVVLVELLAGHARAANSQEAPSHTAASIARAFAGVWKAPEYRVSLNSDLDKSVWGPGVSRVRNVELAIEPDGNGILRILTSVVDSRGRTKPYSASAIDAVLSIGVPQEAATGRVQPQITVVKAEESFLDDRFPIVGATVTLHAPDLKSERFEFRYDTREGTGSFAETLIRE